MWYVTSRQLAGYCIQFPGLSLQGCLRRPPPSFTSPSEGHNLGFLLERGRCTATAQAEGGLKTGLWASGIDQHVLLVALTPNAPHSCYTVVQPGLQSDSKYIELLIQSTQPSSIGKFGLKFWVVSLGCPLAQLCARLPLSTCCLTWEVLVVDLFGGHCAWAGGLGADAYGGAEIPSATQHFRIMFWSGPVQHEVIFAALPVVPVFAAMSHSRVALGVPSLGLPA